jgi:NAD(P)-dependent dehydrogenase (short-subunit alcohol dehydrogenase family)
VPIKDLRRVIDTNVFGYVYGTRAALRYMREQGSDTSGRNRGSTRDRLPGPCAGSGPLGAGAARYHAGGREITVESPDCQNTEVLRGLTEHPQRQRRSMATIPHLT